MMGTKEPLPPGLLREYRQRNPGRTCPCGPCRTRELAVPGARPTRAERWLMEQPEDSHADAWIRQQHIMAYGFAVLNRATVELVQEHGPLVEVGCGAGYWAYELREAGVDIAATDPFQRTRWPGNAVWTTAERLTAEEAIGRRPGMNMLMCWPDMNDRWGERAVRALSAERIVYVGEPRGGCTGTPGMFDAMEELYNLEAEREIPAFTLMRDRIQVLRKRADGGERCPPSP